MDLYAQIATKIIEQQESIIGPVALEQAGHVSNLNIDWAAHRVEITGNPAEAIDDLIDQYKALFGPIAVQVSKDAAAGILVQLPADQQPNSLK